LGGRLIQDPDVKPVALKRMRRMQARRSCAANDENEVVSH
jgi:hypothetical protein